MHWLVGGGGSRSVPEKGFKDMEEGVEGVRSEAGGGLPLPWTLPERPPTADPATMGGDRTPTWRPNIQASPASWGCSLSSPSLPSRATPALPPSQLPPRHAHPGVVAGVELLRHGGDVLHQELVPLPLKADLVHVDVDGRHVFVAALDAAVLEMTEGSLVSGTGRRPPGVRAV